jgi:Xaa-Pro aminopeptidase
MESAGGSAPRPIPAPGSMGVDFEERVDFGRLRAYRLDRARRALTASDLGALLLFDVNNIRYVSSTMIGEWSRDKMTRYCLLTLTGAPIVWDFGSAAKHHRLHAPWLRQTDCKAGLLGLRGAISLLKEAGVERMPLGIDIVEPPLIFELQKLGIIVCDGQQTMHDAREIKSWDEIMLLSTSAAMVDGAYQDIVEALKPGIRENQIVALATKKLYELGADDVESINAVSGERCSPHPHNFSDRLIRPGEQAFFDIMSAFNGYRTCYYRTFSVGYATQPQRDAYKRAREWIDASIALVRPGVTTDVVARAWPKAEDFGFSSEMEAFGLQFGHGLGLALHERPVISRLNSLEHPMEIKAGMVFALETYCPASDGYSAARIEEEIVVTETGPSVITRFPAHDLFVTNPYDFGSPPR